MEYNSNELRKIYDESIQKKLSFQELQDFKNSLELICPRMEYDEFILQDIIDSLLYFKRLNILNNLNNETITLLSQIAFADKKAIFQDDNNLFINTYLRDLLLPPKQNKCDKDYNIRSFLGEFDIFLNLIRDNCQDIDYQTIHKYNNDLYEIVTRFNIVMNYIEETNLFTYGSNKDRLLLNGIFSHLATLMYFSLDKYDNDYNLLNDAYEEILSNIINFLVICDDYQIFQDLIPNDEQEILREYKLAMDILDKEYQKKIKRRKL